jgi:hypothetical protein
MGSIKLIDPSIEPFHLPGIEALKGHDFSRAVNAFESGTALAAEGRLSESLLEIRVSRSLSNPGSFAEPASLAPNPRAFGPADRWMNAPGNIDTPGTA